MEKALEKGEDKIQKICDALRRETLDPARAEAELIIEEAKAKADQIIKDAHKQSERHLAEARKEIEQEKSVFHSSLEQAGKQTLEEIRQVIEHSFFNNELQRLVQDKTADPDLISKLVTAIVNAIEKEGISKDIAVIIPKVVNASEVNRLLGEGILKKLKDEKVELGGFAGGAKVKLLDKKMTLDISDRSLIELLASYVRKDFRKLLFKGG